MAKRDTSEHQGVRPLILASASPRRLDLLTRAGVPCKVVPSGVDEAVHPAGLGSDPARTCLLNARRKAQDVAGRVAEPCLVLGADTIVVIDGEVLGKPRNSADARRMLTLLSGRSHQVLTGCAIVDTSTGATQTFVVTTDVTFKPLLEDEVTGYVATGEPLDKAGAYGIQGRGAFLVATVQGSYTNVVGLPLAETLDALARMGGPRAFTVVSEGAITPT